MFGQAICYNGDQDVGFSAHLYTSEDPVVTRRMKARVEYRRRKSLRFIYFQLLLHSKSRMENVSNDLNFLAVCTPSRKTFIV